MTDDPLPSGGRALGRKSIRPSALPRDLLADTIRPGAWTAHVITLLPEAFPGVLGLSLTGRALAQGVWSLDVTDLRAFGEGRHRAVDDTPAGGGAGMVLRADVGARALDHVLGRVRGDAPRILLSPRGRPFDQARARDLAARDGVVLFCGRFEGVDQRLIDAYGLEEVSVGDFVLTGGEIAAQALIDATVRLMPRVLGNHRSAEDESFSSGLLEYPQYTKPPVWQGRAIPEVLLSGHHARIDAWRREEAERLTQERRPDLWRAHLARRGRPAEDRELSGRDTPPGDRPGQPEGGSDGPDR
ncbi:tRNA (guanosine(37)-N1)-methyltransferase TrmD [Rubellimicrobium sp. CFH 75288]|uniref:tRNA (guanosine(37)-N1)-methyltransferase TrmD n=1 Tax=Rubellimicrobium sp. CFH 75288 TaxID=2697034 RepID=UPI001411C61D|nr:tRNA (guanosine(37)-N1)-methyltransferase TrmD [Rubellimicrobium sp. CFH 75288]NAZ37969.1 tRNA (guanosine(37)-N1)-methyltransferase TrmD [Rubellimicrobium sp. CFH 75288]